MTECTSNPDLIPDLIKERFPVPPPQVFGAKNGFRRIVLYEFCPKVNCADIDIRKIDFRMWDLMPTGTSHADQKDAAQNLSEAILASSCLLGNITSTEWPVSLKIDDLFASSEDRAGFDALKAALTNIGDSKIFVYPSHFDLEFEGSTIVIVRSCIDHLHFRTDGLVFLNPNDKRYYRDIRISADMRTLCFTNSYWDGGTKKPDNLNTPYNQIHKIDFHMVWSNWGWHDVKKSMEWLMTPIRIDPPMDNTGGGGPPGP